MPRKLSGPLLRSIFVTMAIGCGIAIGMQLLSPLDLASTGVLATTTQAPSSTGLLQAQNLVYQGAFRVPVGSPADDAHSANYGGDCLTYNPAGNGGKGSLLICGMNTARLVGEISVPAQVISSSVSALPSAALVSNFVDVLGGHVNDVCPGCGSTSNYLGGLLVYGSQLIVTAYVYFDTDAHLHPASHFLASADLKNPRYIGGPYQVGNPAMPGFVDGYMTPIPAAFQAALGGPFLTGQCCLPIIGRTSYGPSATVFNPSDLGRVSPVPASRWLGYPATHHTLGDWASSGGLWNGSSRAAGAVFPTGSRSILFFGTLGTGPFCYGTGTADPALHGQPVPNDGTNRYCYDPTNVGGKGPTNYPYKFFVWAYDANEFASVKAGAKNFYDVVPYSTWEFNLPILYPAGPGAKYSIGSVAYDEINQRIFITQKGVDSIPSTIVHTFSVQTGAGSGGLCR